MWVREPFALLNKHYYFETRAVRPVRGSKPAKAATFFVIRLIEHEPYVCRNTERQLPTSRHSSKPKTSRRRRRSTATWPAPPTHKTFSSCSTPSPTSSSPTTSEAAASTKKIVGSLENWFLKIKLPIFEVPGKTKCRNEIRSLSWQLASLTLTWHLDEPLN